MYSTLLELERTHGCPMVVRDAFSHSWFLILGKDEESNHGFIYKAKPLNPNQYKPQAGVGTQLIYGGYNKWVFIAKPEATTNDNEISPENQKRIREMERKRSNERITAELRRGKRQKEQANAKKLNAGKESKVIPFKRKEEP